MRYLPPTLAAFILVLFASNSQAEIRWESNLRAAHDRAQQEGKLLLLHFYSDNCVWCDRLEAGAFQQPEVGQAIHSDYVPVKIHAGQNPALAQTFRVNRFPTDVIVRPDGTALAHGTSRQAPQQYIAMLRQHVPAAAPTDAAPAGLAATGVAAIPASHRNPVGLSDPASLGEPAATAPAMGAPLAGDPATDATATNIPAAAPKVTPPKLALDGYCAVSIIEKSQWVEGDPEFGVIHLGNLYLFVDQATMEKFLAAPEPYTPVLNGIDVVRFFEEKKIVPGKRDFGVKDPDHNRMFFFFDEAAMLHFEEQHTRYTEAAINVTRQAIADANPRGTNLR